MSHLMRRFLSRRDFLRAGLGGAAGLAGAALLSQPSVARPLAQGPNSQHSSHSSQPMEHGAAGMVGEVDNAGNGFDPMQILVDWDYGQVSTLPNGQTLREYTIVALDKDIELEFSYRWPGQYMFHAHVSEFAELGWMGHFNVVKPEDFPAALAQVGLDETWDRKSTQGATVPWRIEERS